MRNSLLLLGVLVLRMGGCHQHPLTDYRPLDQVGMWSSSVEQLKTLNTSDAEVTQIVKLKQAGMSDEACVTMVTDARARQHLFSSADSAVNLVHAGYSESQVLEIARIDLLDVISGDAVMLRLVGLSDAAVDTILHRRLKGLTTMSSAEIGRLKNTGLTEKQIMEQVNAGMTDAQADKEAALREAARNHSNTGFVRTHGRRSR
jgi:fatty acid-binding protein DegV